jgi:hypothetical protein
MHTTTVHHPAHWLDAETFGCAEFNDGFYPQGMTTLEEQVSAQVVEEQGVEVRKSVAEVCDEWEEQCQGHAEWNGPVLPEVAEYDGYEKAREIHSLNPDSSEGILYLMKEGWAQQMDQPSPGIMKEKLHYEALRRWYGWRGDWDLNEVCKAM